MRVHWWISFPSTTAPETPSRATQGCRAASVARPVMSFRSRRARSPRTTTIGARCERGPRTASWASVTPRRPAGDRDRAADLARRPPVVRSVIPRFAMRTLPGEGRARFEAALLPGRQAPQQAADAPVRARGPSRVAVAAARRRPAVARGGARRRRAQRRAEASRDERGQRHLALTDDHHRLRVWAVALADLDAPLRPRRRLRRSARQRAARGAADLDGLRELRDERRCACGSGAFRARLGPSTSATGTRAAPRGRAAATSRDERGTNRRRRSR